MQTPPPYKSEGKVLGTPKMLRARAVLQLSRPAALALARGLPSSGLRLRSTAAEPKVTRDIGYSVVDELERLEALPWYRSLPLRLGGVFSDSNRQAAAASDMYMHCVAQASDDQFFAPAAGGLEDRYYRRFQTKGLHCWLCYARLLQEPKELSHTIRTDMMEKLWEQVTLDLSEGIDEKEGMDFVTLSKHLKDLQHGWHGFARTMDEALASDDPRAELADALLRNFYADEEGDLGGPEAEAAAARLAEYVQAQLAHLKAIPTEEMLRARISWAPVAL